MRSKNKRIGPVCRLARLVLLTGMLLLAGQQAVAGSGELPLDTALRTGRLPNGLTYYIRHNENPKGRANFYIVQRVGSIQEEDNQRGLAHFLEHMCFNGTRRFPGKGIIRFCEGIGVQYGGNLNAYTSIDHTVYNIDNVPTERSGVLDTCLLILRDWADGLLLDSVEIDKERGVIREEWRMRSSAMQRMLERQLPALYPESRYGHRMPIGLMSVIDSFRPATLKDYYERWYRPDLQGVVVVGDFDVHRMEQTVKRCFADLRMPLHPAPYVSYPVPDNSEAIVVTDKDKEQSVTLLTLYFKTDPLPRSRRNTYEGFTASVMQTMAAVAVNDRLAELSVKNPDAPFSSVGFDYGDYLLSTGKKAFILGIVPKTGQDTAALKMALREVERVLQHGLTPEEFDRTAQSLLGYYAGIYENRNKQTNDYYTQECVNHFLYNAPYPGLEQEYALLRKVLGHITAGDLNRLLRSTVTQTDSNLVVTAFYPEKEGVTPLSPQVLLQAVHQVREESLAPYVDEAKDGPLVPVRPRPGRVTEEQAAPHGYTCWTLSNGARVYWRATDFSDNQVLFSAVSRGGMSLLPDSDLVSARLLPTVINESGRGGFTSVELAKRLAGKQVGLSVSLGELTENVEGASTKNDLETMMQLFYLTMTDVKNEPDVFRLTMNQLNTYFENADKNPSNALNDTVRAVLYGNNPHAAVLTRNDLKHVSYESIHRIFRERFANAADFTYFFTGNLQLDTLRRLVEQYIAPLPAQKRREDFRDNKARPVKGRRTRCFSRAMETPQATIVQFRYADVRPTVRQSMLADLAGQTLTMACLDTLREDRGMAYSVGAAGALKLGAGSYVLLQVACPVKPALCDSARSLIDQAVERMARQGTDSAYLERAREYSLKVIEEQRQKNAYWHSLIASAVVWNYDPSEGQEEVLRTVTSEDLQRFMARLLKEGSRVEVVMTPLDSAAGKSGIPATGTMSAD